MAGSFQIWLGGAPVDLDFHDRVEGLEVEESAELPGVLELKLGLARTPDGELGMVNDPRLQPMGTVAVVATAEGASPECIFDGCIVAHRVHVETGLTASHLTLQAQDSSVLLGLEEKTRLWADTTDAAVANAVFGEHGIAPGPDNLDDDSPTHTEDGHALMQRGSDWQLLRLLARRSGKLCRIIARSAPAERVGIFAKPRLDAEPVATLTLNDPQAPNIGALDIAWDIARPSRVVARAALFTDDSPGGVTGDTDASGLPEMDARGLAAFAGQPRTALLAASVDDAGELAQRARAVLRDAGWFVRCTGEADLAVLHRVLRVGGTVALAGVGSVHSGNYLVWSVRHRIDTQSHKMSFVLVRNAVGPAATAGAGLPGGLSL